MDTDTPAIFDFRSSITFEEESINPKEELVITNVESINTDAMQTLEKSNTQIFEDIDIKEHSLEDSGIAMETLNESRIVTKQEVNSEAKIT